MEPEDDNGWRTEMGKFFRSVENLTETALKRIKRDRIRKSLPFDKAFKNYFLQKTNARIANAYTDFLLDENCGGGQNHPNQDVNQRSANDNANILEMPVIMEQSNNQNASTPLVQNGNEVSEQIVISIPSNPLTSPQNLEQESHAQSVRTNIPVVNEANDGTNMERLIESEPNSGNENRNSARSRLTVASASASVGSLEFHGSFGRMVNSNERQPETIYLTTDEGEVDGVTGGEQSGNTVLNVQIQGRCPSKVNKCDAHMKSRMMTPKSQIESPHTKQRMERDMHARGPNVATELDVLQHSKTVTSTNAIDAVTADDEDFELVTNSGIATVPKVNDNQQIGPIALSDIKTEFNSNEAKSDKARARGDKNGDQRLQYPEAIDLISDDEETVSQAATNFLKNANAKRYLNKKSNLANKHAVDAKKLHKCNFCEYSTNKKSHLNYHIRTHTNERPYRCEVCKKLFTVKQNLNRHMKTHRDMFAFQCSNCRRGFSNEKKWKWHESRCRANQYECFLCGKRCHQNKSHLLQHMRYKHTGEKPFGCSDCSKRFCHKSNLTRHTKCRH